MKVAIAISGLPRKVEEGYNQFWKSIIEKYNADVYLHFWKDEEYEKILSIYNPKKYIYQEPFSFASFTDIINARDKNSNYSEKYGVGGNMRSFPLFYGWQQLSSIVDNDYDFIIRGRYDIEGKIPDLNLLDTSKIYVSGIHWYNIDRFDDNLFISNSKLFKSTYFDCFDYLMDYARTFGNISFQEENFTTMLLNKSLYNFVQKDMRIKFGIIKK